MDSFSQRVRLPSSCHGPDGWIPPSLPRSVLCLMPWRTELKSHSCQMGGMTKHSTYWAIQVACVIAELDKVDQIDCILVICSSVSIGFGFHYLGLHLLYVCWCLAPVVSWCVLTVFMIAVGNWFGGVLMSSHPSIKGLMLTQLIVEAHSQDVTSQHYGFPDWYLAWPTILFHKRGIWFNTAKHKVKRFRYFIHWSLDRIELCSKKKQSVRWG